MAVPFSVRLVFLSTMNDLTDVALYRRKALGFLKHRRNKPMFWKPDLKTQQGQKFYSTVVETQLQNTVKKGKKRHLLAKHFH